jgi:hypothetical protein
VDLDLYSVSASGRVILGNLVAGVEFLTAEKDDATGKVTLTPVRINPARSRPADTGQGDTQDEPQF